MNRLGGYAVKMDWDSGNDFVYTDNRVEMEFFGESRYVEEKSRRLEEMLPYQLKREVLRGHDPYIMHDMPIHARKSS